MRLILLSGVIFLSGCATTYQPQGATGGFSNTALAPDVQSVRFAGNGYTSAEDAQDFAMLRAAELMREGGFPYFIVIGADAGASTATAYLPGSTTTTASAHMVGNTAYGQATSYSSPGFAVPIRKPYTQVIVQGLTEKPAEGFAFETEFVIRSIKQKHIIPE